MNNLKHYIGAVILGVIAFFLLRLGCSTQPKVEPVVKPYQLKFDSSYFNDRLDSLTKVICLLREKKSPLFQRQKDERKRADVIIETITKEEPCTQVDTLIDLLYRERKNCDSIVAAYQRDSLVNIELVSTLKARGDSAVKELNEVVPQLDSSRLDNFKLRGENSKLKKQRNGSVILNVAQFLLNLIL